MVAELERDPAFATSRGTGGAPVPPPPSIRSPAALADAVDFRPLDTRGVAEKTGARIVAPGPYQKAAPATRMESAPANVVAEAIKLSGRHPELLEPIPTETLQMHLDLAKAFGSSDEAAVRAVEAELAKRAAAGRSLPGGEPVSPDMSLRSVLGDESGRLGPLYHGSPHKFDKFDLSKIGTGEGAQAYGHGAYLAEGKGVGQNYRDQLSRGQVKIMVGDKDITPSLNRGITGDRLIKNGEDMAVSLVEDALGRGRKNPIKSALKYAMESQNLSHFSQSQKELNAEAAKVLESWKSQGAKASPGGYLYTAELPNANAEDFLDWDKPLSQQPPKVQEAIRSAYKAAGEPLPEIGDYAGAPSGESAYRSLTSTLIGKARDEGFAGAGGPVGEGQRRASEALRKAGVRGIRYLDGGSRGNGAAAAHWERVLAEGNATGEYGGLTRQQVLDKLDEAKNALSSNYVVFDDADINILHREGNTGLKMLLGMTGAGAAAAAAPKLIPKRH